MNWLLGDVGQARQIMEAAVARALETAHVPTQTNVYGFKVVFEIIRGDAAAASRTADALIDLSREHGLPFYVIRGLLCSNWARARLGERQSGASELRRILVEQTAQGNKFNMPLFYGLLAELEAEENDTERAAVRIDEALALANETTEHGTDSFLHRIRGEIFLKRDLANTTPAEEAFLTAIAVALQQKARSFELRAALSLARLYQSTDRAADAHAVLAPALEGFSPTPEFPEIEEAQALLAALAGTDEVKNAAASRQRRLQLQTSLASALLQARGQHSPETQEAFSRARELAGGVEDPLQRFSSYYGLWVGGYARSEKSTMTEAAEAMLKEAESRPDTAEASIAHRINGVTCWVVGGDVAIARDHLKKAVALYRPERDRELVYRFAQDIGVSAMIYFSLVEWIFGQHARSRELMTQALALAGETKHVPTQVYALTHAAVFEMIRLDPDAAKRHAEAGLALAREHGLKLWTVMLPPALAWAIAYRGRTLAEWEKMRSAAVDWHAQGIVTFNDWMSRGSLGGWRTQADWTRGSL